MLEEIYCILLPFEYIILKNLIESEIYKVILLIIYI